MTIFKALTAVKRDLGAVSKDGKMNFGTTKYNYRGIDDVLNKLHPVLIQHGVIFVPQLVSKEQSGKTTHVIVEYTVGDAEGNTIVARTPGEGDDSGDKGTNKAMTGALKVFLAQTFAIPFETDDPDDYPSVAAPKAPAEVKAKPAPKAAQEKLPHAVEADKASAQGSSNEILCAECGYSVGSGPIKRKQGKTFHKECADGKPAAPKDEANNIESIIDSFPGAE